MKTEKMTHLVKKYYENQLSVDELSTLKESINAASDEELEKIMTELWQQDDGSSADEETITGMKQEIDRLNARQKWQKRKLLRILFRAAAIIAVPLVAAITINLLDRLPAPAASDMIVSVGPGEKVNIVLPDGTRVKLNSETTLNYSINDFNRKLREIDLRGEAYFEVARNERKPFIINTKSLDIKVLGTVFNLQAREDELTTEIDLLEGEVALTSNTTNQQVRLYASQRAVLDKTTGSIRIIKNVTPEGAAWVKGELVFHATPVRNVLKAIERNYGVSIHLDRNDSIFNDLFTGKFSTGNLNETLDILKMHYRFNYQIKGNDVAISNFRLNQRKN
jgi:ferric-dicitrate binding protein FerR (iron transport regulator)